jgi:hypothetical protein
MRHGATGFGILGLGRHFGLPGATPPGGSPAVSGPAASRAGSETAVDARRRGPRPPRRNTADPAAGLAVPRGDGPVAARQHALGRESSGAGPALSFTRKESRRRRRSADRPAVSARGLGHAARRADKGDRE